MRNILLMLFSYLCLTNCAQTTALIGPAITIGSTGNVMQAGFSYGSNMVVKEATGKTPGEHLTNYVDQKKEEKRIKKKILILLETHVDLMKKKLNNKKKL